MEKFNERLGRVDIGPKTILNEFFKKHGICAEETRVAGLDYSMWPIHSATNLEILKNCEELGASVLYQRNLVGSAPSYFRPYIRERLELTKELLRQLEIPNYRLLKTKYRDIEMDEIAKEVYLSINDVTSTKELKQLRVFDNPVGYTIASTLFAQFRTEDIPKKSLHRWAKRYFLSYIQGFNDAMNLHQRENYDVFVIFNGRFPSVRGAGDFAKQANLLCIAHDIEPFVGRYTFLKDSVHSPKSAREFYELLEVSDSSEDGKVDLEEYYEARLRKDTPAVRVFSKTWTGNSFKKTIPTPYVAIFSSSDHEHFSINPNRDFENSTTQMEWIANLTSELLKFDYRVAIRFHPNSEVNAKMIKEKWIKRFKGTKKLHLFLPQDNVDSYELAMNSSVNITTFSTIAAECAYLGIPIISTGFSMYEFFIPLDKVNKALEIVPKVESLLEKDISLSRKSALRQGAIKYAEFQKKRFFEFIYLPGVENPDTITNSSEHVTRTYGELRRVKSLEKWVIRILYKLRFRILLH